MIRENYHTHSIFCDGSDAPEDMVLAAIKKGFNVIGFSGHGHTGRDESYCMSVENTAKYIDEVTRLKEKYKDEILVLLGIEQDVISEDSLDAFDYVIGSTHYLEKDGKLYNADGSKDEFYEVLSVFGSLEAAAKVYFDSVERVAQLDKCHIIGHFDLLSKNFERCGIKESEAYLERALKAVDKLIPLGIPFEINTGAIARGYRTTPYPSENILKYIFQKGGRIIFTSDCHNKDYIDCYYSEAEALARRIGFTKRSIITARGLEETEL